MPEPRPRPSHGPDPTRARPPIPDTPEIRAAREYGIDIGLLISMLEMSPDERLRSLDENVAFLSAAADALRRGTADRGGLGR